MSSRSGRATTELSALLEIASPTPETLPDLAHNAIPIQFTDEELTLVASGTELTKVIYLPQPEFQELALAGVETLVSVRPELDQATLANAKRHGDILAVIRVSND